MSSGNNHRHKLKQILPFILKTKKLKKNATMIWQKEVDNFWFWGKNSISCHWSTEACNRNKLKLSSSIEKLQSCTFEYFRFSSLKVFCHLSDCKHAGHTCWYWVEVKWFVLHCPVKILSDRQHNAEQLQNHYMIDLFPNLKIKWF